METEEADAPQKLKLVSTLKTKLSLVGGSPVGWEERIRDDSVLLFTQ